MARRPVIGVMGAGDDASEADMRLAEALGQVIAAERWIVLTGGRDAGVMQAASRGAKRVSGSLVIGVLPSDRDPVSPDVDVAILTGLGNARNAINVLSSQVVVAVGIRGPGTASEAALALKAKRPLILLAPTREAEAFFRTLGGEIFVTDTAEKVPEIIKSQHLLDVDRH
jgi:uncharacterized protein (TIGR00725 family)